MRDFEAGQHLYGHKIRQAPAPSWMASQGGAPAGSRPGTLQFSQGVAPGRSTGRRYVGRSSSRSAQQKVEKAVRPMPQSAPRPVKPPTRTSSQPVAVAAPRPRVAPWSLRLAATLVLISSFGLALRLLGVFTPPVDAPLGVEATHAAFANVLAGRVEGASENVRLLPAPPPWHGAAPTDPNSGLPLHGWLTALGMRVLGAGDSVGRVVSIVFSLLAGAMLFSVVRQTAGVRAALYAMLMFTIAPLSIVLGQHFSPASLLLAAQAGALLTLVRWRLTVSEAAPQGSGPAFALAIVVAALAGLLDPGGIFLAAPAAYLMLTSASQESQPLYTRATLRASRSAARDWREAWQQSPYKGKLLGYVGALVGASAVWWLFSSGSAGALALGIGDGGGGVGVAVAALLQGSTYVQLVGSLVEKVLTIVGLLLLVAGLLHGARPPLQALFHAWLAGGLLHVLADASRLGRHDDALLPLLLPVSALVGIGAAWCGSFPARVWLAVTEQRRERDDEYHISPHTAWLLDLPEERADEKPPRPQAKLALGKAIAQRTRWAGARARRAWLIGFGHLLILGAFALVASSGLQMASSRLQSSVEAVELRVAGASVRDGTPSTSRLIITGPHAAELFYASGRAGWALTQDEFNIGTVQALQRGGADYLLSADQEWLGRHADYRGLLANYSVKQLSRNYILFDLSVKAADNDRLYFLESGHTLGGEFRRFWESRGGVAKLGYPISEEFQEASPLDGQVRTVQYFERAVLEHHPEFAGTPDTVMLAAVGRWVTQGRTFPTVPPFENTEDRAYFPETGHSLKEAFLRFWLREGGLAQFGYPISEEMPEISAADGKVYTVQYFERARFEWHPTEAGTPNEVQLGLIGKQALEMGR